ncbi:low-density lipoprotein receptor-related protein 4-like [Saccostrea cucullata]|uniref:low-density lipoprotein receptor-related protein 4-like n=1 Tax=Saccostrea cuccullata TaxID=36930 RepID=UPI002ED68F84
MAFRCFFLYVYLLYELQGKCLADDRGIVLGVWNNASLSTITKIPTSGTNQITTIPFPLNPINTKITSIAAVPRNKMLFVSAGREIFAINNYSIWQNESLTFSVIFSGKSYAFGQIAFDHLSNNLYWCDGFLNWIAMKSLNVNNTNTTYKVIIDKHLEQPEGLALDPEDGLLFFSENSPSVRIEKASLDGENRSVIVYRSLLRIMSLSTDTENNLLYWADLDRETVEVCNYDGSNRKVLRRMVDIPLTGVQYFEGVIHGVSLRRRKLVGIDVNSREILYEVTLQIGDPFVLAVYDVKTNTSLTDPCSGQYCQHICVNTPPGPKCLCAEGYILGADSYSCNERSWFYDKGIIVNNATMFYMLDTRSLNGQAERVPYFQIPTAIMTTFAINAYSREIYFADAKRNEIYKLDIYTNRYSNILSTNPVAGILKY